MDFLNLKLASTSRLPISEFSGYHCNLPLNQTLRRKAQKNMVKGELGKSGGGEEYFPNFFYFPINRLIEASLCNSFLFNSTKTSFINTENVKNINSVGKYVEKWSENPFTWYTPIH